MRNSIKTSSIWVAAQTHIHSALVDLMKLSAYLQQSSLCLSSSSSFSCSCCCCCCSSMLLNKSRYTLELLLLFSSPISPTLPIICSQWARLSKLPPFTSAGLSALFSDPLGCQWLPLLVKAARQAECTPFFLLSFCTVIFSNDWTDCTQTDTRWWLLSVHRLHSSAASNE